MHAGILPQLFEILLLLLLLPIVVLWSSVGIIFDVIVRCPISVSMLVVHVYTHLKVCAISNFVCARSKQGSVPFTTFSTKLVQNI